MYNDFLQNVKAFKNLNALPVNLPFRDDIDVDTLLSNSASWHKNCHQLFNRSKLERVIQKRKQEEITNDVEQDAAPILEARAKRRAIESKNICMFCQEGHDTLHECSSLLAGNKLKIMATEMQDTELLSKVACYDVVASETKYHLDCLTKYRNKYRTFQCHQDSNQLERKHVQAKIDTVKARVFLEVMSHVEECVKDGTFIFKLSDLYDLCITRLQAFGVYEYLHKTRFKDDILNYFADSMLQEQRVGKSIILAFPEGIQQLLKDKFLVHDIDDELKVFAKVANICRDEIFQQNTTFNGSFKPECQEQITPKTRLLVSMILYGTNLDVNVKDSQQCLTINQLLYFNAKKYTKKPIGGVNSKRYCSEREPPLPVYVGLSLHKETRSKLLVDEMAKLGLSSSYRRIVQIQNSLALSICNQYERDGVVCPSPLRYGIYTVGAMDNIDHNPSSTTSQGSFHGTAVSIMQQPSVLNSGIIREPPEFVKPTNISNEISLPETYSLVPSIYFKQGTTEIPKANMLSELTNGIIEAKGEEILWLKKASDLLDRDIVKTESLSWAAFHASNQNDEVIIPAITTLLPMFVEKADSPAMVKHAMTIVQNVTGHLNPGQIPVVACDCPIFAMSKYIQWAFPNTHGEDKIIIMFGGLHIEKALWTALGDLLNCSGWTEAISKSEISTTGTADSFLKATHIMKTRHAHQVTVVALHQLQQQAFEQLSSNESDESFETFDAWKNRLTKESPTYYFWDLIKELEMLILIFVRAERTKNFNLYLESLDSLMFLFFSLDHYNYSRWLSVHLRDMMSLPANVRDDFKKGWVIQKTPKRFSAIPIDQCHEQENAKVKGKGGAIGLTENPETFRKWMVVGPEQTRLLSGFEDEYLPKEVQDFQHHEESETDQKTFQKQVNNLITTFNEYGNPFLDDCDDLLILHTRECAEKGVINTLRNISKIGKQQYEAYKNDVIQSRSKSIHDPIKRNQLPLLKTPRAKRDVKSQQLMCLRNEANLFGRLYIANQQRGGDLSVFFSHENQPHPPSLSDYGKLRIGTKSELLKCFDVEENGQFVVPDTFDCKIFDGGALIHSLNSGSSVTFDDYAKTKFIPFLKHELQQVDKRIDVVWDQYLDGSLKESLREKRGSGIRVKVGPQAKIPSKWNDFLLQNQNKTELFEYLSDKVNESRWFDGKAVYITKGTEVISNHTPMDKCTQEEADSRMIVHIVHAIKEGCKKMLVQSGDTDVLVILIGHFFFLQQLCPEINLWLAFGNKNNTIMYSINQIAEKLGQRVCEALPVFHAFTGCDTTSSFYRKGKRIAWNAWKCFASITDVFYDIRHNPFQQLSESVENFSLLEKFTIAMYDKGSTSVDINEARREMFTKKSTGIESIPPTKDALLQHAKRAVYQAGIWSTCYQNEPIYPNPQEFGWRVEEGKYVPLWMTLPEASKACKELIKCGCKSSRGCTTCKCAKSGLRCTDLCSCSCER